MSEIEFLERAFGPPMHLLVIRFIALLLFGPSKLADLGKGLGQGIRGFKDGLNDEPAEPKQS